jgi:hypothetical protein
MWDIRCTACGFAVTNKNELGHHFATAFSPIDFVMWMQEAAALGGNASAVSKAVAAGLTKKRVTCPSCKSNKKWIG